MKPPESSNTNFDDLIQEIKSEEVEGAEEEIWKKEGISGTHRV
ncbi:hypothetical protein S225a_19540 [Candidatus Brocadiaceae bacterium S225]|nr:hypothetical protein S225a_19540 [Candidatus Brocadiaceae bacterium S225]